MPDLRGARRPYVGEGADGCRRSAQIDREEAEQLMPGTERHDELLASAEGWEWQARAIELQDELEAGAGTPDDVVDAVIVEELTPRERAARRLLGIAALEKLLKEEKAALRADAAAVFTKAGQREVAELPDGTPLGNVRVDKAPGGWKVTDAGKLRAWVEKHHPERIVEEKTTVVDPAWIVDVLAGGLVDPDSGEVLEPDGVENVPAGTKLVVTADKGAAVAVKRWLGPTAAQLGIGAE